MALRGHKTLIDADLAALYGVSTKRLNEQVKRSRARFPADFVFQLTSSERVEVVAKCDHLSRAVEVSVYVVRAFVHLREQAASRSALLSRLNALESKYDRQFKAVFDAIRELMRPPHPAQRQRIGFVRDE